MERIQKENALLQHKIEETSAPSYQVFIILRNQNNQYTYLHNTLIFLTILLKCIEF